MDRAPPLLDRVVGLMRLRAGILLALVQCGGARAPSAAVDYAIRLHRPIAVGTRWHLVADGTSAESTSTYTEQVILKKTDKHATVHLDATATVVAADDVGTSRTDYAIAAFEKEGKPVLSAGQHVVVEGAASKEDARVEVDGQPATAEVRDALAAVVSLERDAVNEDALFGTPERVRVGSSWPIAAAPMRASLERKGVLTTDDAIAGKVTLGGTERVGSEDCLDLRVELLVKSFKPKPGRLREGSEVTKSRVALTAAWVLPVEPTRQTRRAVLDVHTEFEAFIPAQSAEVTGVTFELRSDTHRVESLTPI